MLNMCANNYLGLADHPEVVQAAHDALTTGATAWRRSASSAARRSRTRSSSRRSPSSSAPRTRSSIPPAGTPTAACSRRSWAAKTRVISDELNHASIIDGIRLCKAQRLRYKNNDMADLEAKLPEAGDARFRLIATDGVFSMDGIIADLKAICDLADKYDALVMVDDSHAVGFMGKQRPRHARVPRRDGPRRHPHRHARQGPGRSQRRLHQRPWRDHRMLLRQRSRPYLFSNSVAPPILGASLKALEICTPLDRAARPAGGEHEVLPRGDDRAEVSTSSPASTRSRRS